MEKVIKPADGEQHMAMAHPQSQIREGTSRWRYIGTELAICMHTTNSRMGSERASASASGGGQGRLGIFATPTLFRMDRLSVSVHLRLSSVPPRRHGTYTALQPPASVAACLLAVPYCAQHNSTRAWPSFSGLDRFHRCRSESLLPTTARSNSSYCSRSESSESLLPRAENASRPAATTRS
jgi:hypothetical protein